MKYLHRYVERKCQLKSQQEIETVCDFMYQIISRKGTTENCIFVNYDLSLKAKLPLGDKVVPSLPIVTIYGENDWTKLIDDSAAERMSQLNRESRVFELPNSDHNLHYDNPIGLCKLLKK